MVGQGPPWLTRPIVGGQSVGGKKNRLFMEDQYSAGKVSTGVNIWEKDWRFLFGIHPPPPPAFSCCPSPIQIPLYFPSLSIPSSSLSAPILPSSLSYLFLLLSLFHSLFTSPSSFFLFPFPNFPLQSSFTSLPPVLLLPLPFSFFLYPFLFSYKLTSPAKVDGPQTTSANSKSANMRTYDIC